MLQENGVANEAADLEPGAIALSSKDQARAQTDLRISKQQVRLSAEMEQFLVRSTSRLTTDALCCCTR